MRWINILPRCIATKANNKGETKENRTDITIRVCLCVWYLMRTVHYRSYERILKFTISKNVKITPKISKNLMWCVYVFCCAVTNSMSIKIWLWMCRMVKHTVLNKSIALCSVCSVLIFSPLHLFEFRIHINFNSKLKFFMMKIRGYITTAFPKISRCVFLWQTKK